MTKKRVILVDGLEKPYSKRRKNRVEKLTILICGSWLENASKSEGKIQQNCP